MARRGNISANGFLFPLSQPGIGIEFEHIPLFKAMKPRPKLEVTRFGPGCIPIGRRKKVCRLA